MSSHVVHSRIKGTCYLLATALVLSGLVHLGILIVTGGPWEGPLSWRKPASFGLSFGAFPSLVV